MIDFASIFLDVKLPNAATWFYCSLLLAVALFFKFSRLLSMRNLDLALLFLPTPGLLLLLDPEEVDPRWGYGWLLGVAVVLLVRCLLDLALERRPALSPNLLPGGLAWLGAALFLSLVVVAISEPRLGSLPNRSRTPLTVAVKGESEQLLDRQPNLPDSDLAAERSLTVLCHLAVIIALVFIGWRHFRDPHVGVAIATLYLLLPYAHYLLPYTGRELEDGKVVTLDGQWHHVWPAALLTWAVALYRKPTFSGLLLGIAAASVYHPVLVFPVWLSFYWRRGSGRFAAAFVLGAGLCLGWLLMRVWVRADGPETSAWPLDVRDWLPWVSPARDAPSFWKGVHWAYRMPLFLLFLVLLFVGTCWPMPKNLGHVIALSAAMLLGAQLWYADRGGMHVLWYLPLLLLLAFRPNLSTCQAPPIPHETDWLRRLGSWLAGIRTWVIGQPRPTVTPAQASRAP